MIPDGVFRPGLELMTYLDGNLSSNGLDDPALGIVTFHLAWWTSPNTPTGNTSCLCSATIKSALNHYRRQLAAALKTIGVPHRIRDLSEELNKPSYTWHSSINDDDLPNNCTRCRLYRAVALGAVDQVRDVYNMVHGCEVASGAEKDIAIRRASGFNELYDAVLSKECIPVDSGSGSGPEQGDESGSGLKGKGKEKQQPVPEVKKLSKWVWNKIMEGGAGRWTWGADLTEEDLRQLIRGADQEEPFPHSGYDDDLPSGSLRSVTSEALDAAQLEDWNDKDLQFDDLSSSIRAIPELRTPDIPTFSLLLLDTSGNPIAESEPDSVIEAFAKRARRATKANKLLMQDEVDQPASFFDYGAEFVPQTTLIPRRPWLAPRLPIILPPSNIFPGTTDHAENSVVPDPDTDHEIPDHISISDSDDSSKPDRLMIPDSDSSPMSHIRFPESDDELSDRMDVVRSDEPIGAESDPEIETRENSESGSDSSIDHIILPSDGSGSPMDTRLSMGGLGVIGRDPDTGRFTAASFMHFPDELLD